jgi:AcrR family transcriptional regulator
VPRNEQTKTRILDAALDEFAAKGLAGARVDEIARRAGANKAMIYYHFDSKAGLFNALFQVEMEGLKAELARNLAGRDASSTIEMTAAVRELLTYAEKKKKFLSVLLSSAALQDTFQPHLFQLADLSAAAGLEAAQKSGRGAAPEAVASQNEAVTSKSEAVASKSEAVASKSEAGRKEAVLYELFTGLLPLVFFVLLRPALQASYGWREDELSGAFIAVWLRQHAGV